MKKQVAIMDIGSSKIRVVVVNLRAKNWTISGMGEAIYSGFCDGEFLECQNLKLALGMAISNAEASAGFRIRELYVGLPAEFLTCINKTVELNFAKKKKIGEQDLNNLINKGLIESTELTLLCYNPISYFLENGKTIANPIGIKTDCIKANISYQYVENECLRLLNKAFESLGLYSVIYLSAPLAEGLYLLDDFTRQEGALIVDCGYITTHVALAKGGGLVSFCSFSIGGGHVMTDLARCVKINFAEAESLKRKIVLSLDVSEDEMIEVIHNEETFGLPVKVANEIVEARIEMICQAIEKCLEIKKIEIPSLNPIFLTGGGIAMIKGAKELVSKFLKKPVEILSSNIPQFEKPNSLQLLALILMVIEKEKNKHLSFLAKVLKKW